MQELKVKKDSYGFLQVVEKQAGLKQIKEANLLEEASHWIK